METTKSFKLLYKLQMLTANTYIIIMTYFALTVIFSVILCSSSSHFQLSVNVKEFAERIPQGKCWSFLSTILHLQSVNFITNNNAITHVWKGITLDATQLSCFRLQHKCKILFFFWTFLQFAVISLNKRAYNEFNIFIELYLSWTS